MQTNRSQQLKQYARVARTFPKILSNATNARIRTLVTTKNSQIQ